MSTGDWLVLGIYLAGFSHHWFAMRAEAKTRDHLAGICKRNEVLAEALALAKYGAVDEAVDLLKNSEWTP